MISGLLGLGGGMLLMPALILLGFDAKKAARAVSFVIPFLSGGAFLTYLSFTTINRTLLGAVALAAVAEGYLGQHIMNDRLSPAQVKKGIGALLLLLAAKITWTQVHMCVDMKHSLVSGRPMRQTLFFAVTLLFLAHGAVAQDLEIQPVARNLYALVGTINQRSPENFGNNATFGVIVTPEGVVLVDPGGSWKGAEQIDGTIDRITDKPVKYVIDTGGQDHRWLGNGYWRAQGAVVISSASAEADRYARLDQEWAMLEHFAGKEALEGTEPARADITFDASYTLEFGGETIQIIHPETGGHTPGDSFVWLADKSVMFSGDIVFYERMLGVREDQFLNWIAGFETMAAFRPEYMVPGHGHVTDLAGATHDTYDYLVNLRDKMRAYIAAGGDQFDVLNVDQSDFSDLPHFKDLAGKNAQRAFQELEWE